jgi:hypothetical protein
MDIEKYLLNNRHRSLFGQRNLARINQGDILYLDYVLGRYKKWRTCTELGTGEGLLTLWLGIVFDLRGGDVYSFDNRAPRQFFVTQSWPKSVHFHQANLLGRRANKHAVQAVSTSDFVVFDNGDKASEARIYAPSMKVGAGFAIHDWGSEVNMTSIRKTVEKCSFEAVGHEAARMFKSRFRLFIRKAS